MKNIKKIFALLLSLCLIFCFCSCENNTVDDDDVDKELSSEGDEISDNESTTDDEYVSAPVYTGGGASGDEANLFEKYMYSWDEYLEYRTSEDFVDTKGQQLLWTIKDKLAEFLDFEAVERVFLINQNLTLYSSDQTSFPISDLSISYYAVGAKPYYPEKENDPVLPSITAEQAIAMGHNEARVMLGQREFTVGIKDGNVIYLRFTVNDKYVVLLVFTKYKNGGDDNISASELKGPITFDERIAFATAFADMVTSELTVVTPPPAVTE